MNEVGLVSPIFSDKKLMTSYQKNIPVVEVTSGKMTELNELIHRIEMNVISFPLTIRIRWTVMHTRQTIPLFHLAKAGSTWHLNIYPR